MTAAADPYTRCPECGFVAPPEAMGYALAEDGGIDWDHPVDVACLCCHAHHTISATDVLAPGSRTVCQRCGVTVASPAGAARVRCTGCGVFLIGPELTGRQLEELRITEGLAGLVLAETVRAAKDPAARRGRRGRP